jgi:hypothetical protein
VYRYNSYSSTVKQSLKGEFKMTAYFIKCKNNQMGTESISTTLYYFESQALDIIQQLNTKNDGYTYFLHASNI